MGRFLDTVLGKALVVAGVATIAAASVTSRTSAEIAKNDMARAACIQKKVLKRYKKQCKKEKSIRDRIRENERKISKLENSVRSDLDYKLSCLLQVKELLQAQFSDTDWTDIGERKRIRKEISENSSEISKVKRKIAENEACISAFKRLRSKLDSELAVILQNKEVYNCR